MADAGPSLGAAPVALIPAAVENTGFPVWFDWNAPDYGRVWQDRMIVLKAMRAEPGRWEALRERYRDDPIAFINDWGCTYDPRNVGTSRPTLMPFLLFQKQAEFMDWTRQRWMRREDGLVEKSRDMGISWCCIGFAVWLWIFHPGSVAGFGSYKEEYVDKNGDPKSLFWKARYMIDRLPTELKPLGYDKDSDAPYMRIMNKGANSTIFGEAGGNIGRGARASIYFKDEALVLSARILTPHGWSTMGAMAVGSQVIGADGQAHTVTHVNEAGEHPVYRIGFSDGTSVKCSPNHLWTIERNGRRANMRAHEVAEQYRYESPGGQVQYRLRVPVTRPVQFDAGAALPIDPYVMGALLGDGCLRGSTPGFTSADRALAEEVEELLPEGVAMTRDGAIGYRLVSTVGGSAGRYGPRNEMTALLKRVGAHGNLAQDKHIPQAYLLARPSDRLALLQGLMDTDGSASGGVASFHSSSAQLAADVRFVVESLGGTATHNVKPDHRGYRDMHVLHVCLPMQIFRLERKQRALKPRRHPPGRTITSVELLDAAQVRCITVDAPDGLYLTDHCIVTHNSAHYAQAESIDAALSQTSNVQIDVSTPNGEGNPFWQKRMGGNVSVFVFDWRDDPRKGPKWYEAQKLRMTPVALAQEVDRDYSASVTNSFINSPIVTAAGLRGPAEVRPFGGLRVGLDVARFGDDSNVLTFRRGRVLLKQVKWRKSDLESTAGRARQEILAFKETPEQIAIDVIGVGAGVCDMMRNFSGWKDLIQDVNSALRLSDGQHYNLRALMWTQMRDWLSTASIPNDKDLRASLTALRYFYKGGEMLIESKDDAKKRGIKSPDEADSLALTFAYPGSKSKRPVIDSSKVAHYALDVDAGM